MLNRGRARYEEFWAVREATFEVPRGAILGIIGENGSGKSTVLKCIAGILRPDGGEVQTDGRIAALLELGAGFHPNYSGRENIYLNGALLGLPRVYIDSVMDEIIDFAGEQVSRALDNPVKTYSSGMYARLGFSIAVHLDPDILVVDEILAVGDEQFQRKCFDRIAQMRARGKTMVIVSHALNSIRELCTDVVWMDRGRLVAQGSAETVVTQYLSEVNVREAEVMRREAEAVRVMVPTGRSGVGVTSVTFYRDGEQTEVFETGEPLEVRVEYHSPGPLFGARFGVGFVREDGVLAYTCTTDDAQTAQMVLPEKGAVSFHVPELHLLEGLFRVSVGIVEVATEEPWTVLEKAFPFRVRNLKRKDAGVARLEHRWQLPTPVREEPAAAR